MRPEYEALVAAFVDRQREKGRRSLRKLPYWLAVYFRWLDDRSLGLAEVSPLAAEEFQTYLATVERHGEVHYATGTVASIVATVKVFHQWLVSDGRALRDPFHGLKMIKREQQLPRSIPSQEEMAELLEKLKRFWEAPTVGERRALYRLHVIAELLYATGMRLSELAALTEEDVDVARGVVRIREGKGGVERTAYLNEYAARVLSIYATDMREDVNRLQRKQLFGSVSGIGLCAWLNEHLKRYCGFTSHTFRHSLGTHLLQRGCDLRYIQLILGHNDLKSTALYTKVSKEELRDQLDKCHPRSG